jgi:hypothetical protein
MLQLLRVIRQPILHTVICPTESKIRVLQLLYETLCVFFVCSLNDAISVLEYIV